MTQYGRAETAPPGGLRQVLDHVASDPDSVDDMFKTHLWIKDSTNTFATEISLDRINTIPAFFAAIAEAFLKDNPNCTRELCEKGNIDAIRIMFWNLGVNASAKKGLQNPTTIDRRMTDDVLVRFRNDIALGFQQHRKEEQGERLLCFATVLFENDA